MKIVLELPEVYQILVDHLYSQGRIENKDTSATLHIDKLGNESPTIVIKQ